MTNKFEEIYEEKIRPLGFQYKKLNDREFKIWHENILWAVLMFEKQEGQFALFFYFRTNFGVGERSDIHEVIPLIYTLIFRLNDICTFRFLFEHNEFSAVDDEIYANYIFPSQPLSESVRLDSEKDIDIFIQLINGLLLISEWMCSILEINPNKKEMFLESEDLIAWMKDVNNALGFSGEALCYERINPDWYFYRNYNLGISIVKSKSIVEFLEPICEIFLRNQTALDGVNAKLFLSKDISGSVNHRVIALAKKIIDSLGVKGEVITIPNENITHFLCQDCIINIVNDGGLSSFLNEKELIRVRNAKENSFLFNDKLIRWKINNNKQASVFEDLILELLYREPYIISAKKVSSTNQGDNGRDIICYYDANHNELRVSNGSKAIEVGKLIVQCKSKIGNSKRASINKSDIKIADTIHEYQPDAYLLVSNTQPTRDLTEYLEKIDSRKELHWIDWWNSFDLIERLRMNPDILNKYSDIVEYVE